MSQTYPPAVPVPPVYAQIERRFPILRTYADTQRLLRDADGVGAHTVVIALPWSMIGPHEQQAHRNHGQSLNVLAQRGGLSADEAVAVLEDRAWSAMDHGAALARLADLYLTWELTRRGVQFDSAYAEGVAARRNGGPTVGNPYTIHSSRGSEWLRGWSAADRELRK